MTELNRNSGQERSKVIEQIKVMLSGQLVDVELDKVSFDLVLDLALERYRQRSENSVEEGFIFIQTNENQNHYTLPNEVVTVRKLYRRTFGITSGDSDNGVLDPFDIAFSNLYLLQDGSLGGLATFDFYSQNIELAARMFGYEYNYTYNTNTKKLSIMRRVRAGEEIMARVYMYIPDDILLKDNFAKPWLRSYAMAEAKMILGGAYEKFTVYAGPQGGVSMNGSQLKAEAMQEKMELEDQLKKYADGAAPLGIIMG